MIYVVEYRDSRERWHRARLNFSSAASAVETAERTYRYGWRVLDVDGRQVADHLGSGTGAFERREAELYAALCDRARELGVPTSLDDPRSPRTVTGLQAAVAAAELARRGELCEYVVTLPNGDEAEAVDADAIVRAAQVLVADAAAHGASSSWLRRNLRVSIGGRFDGATTTRAQS